GELPGGRAFQTPDELKGILKEDAGAFAECLTEKMLTYALDRGLERYDNPVLQSIREKLAGNDYRFNTLILEIVRGMPFQMRRGDPGVEKGD
ncbi:MAG: DUF1585 domain-containing protein, partial [bacterium]|nr:DUF1585 domain-containing protein [bacterium]